MAIERICDRCGAAAFDVTPSTPFAQPVTVAKSITVAATAPSTNPVSVGKTLNLSVVLGNDLCAPCAISALHAYITAVGG